MTQPDPRPRSSQVARLNDLDAIIDQATRTVALDEFAARGVRQVRVISRKRLVRDVLDLVEVFLERRLEDEQARLASILDRGCSESEQEGRMRVLKSLVELSDLIDSVVQAVAGTEAAVAGKALDRRIDRIFKNYGFERIPTVGQSFDPALHEALEEREQTSATPGEILEEMGRGYRNDEIVLRVARVVVASDQN